MIMSRDCAWFLLPSLVLLSILQCTPAEPSIENHISDADRARLKLVVALPNSKIESNDLASLYHHVSVHVHLGTVPPDSASICGHLQKTEKSELDAIYYSALTAQLLAKCSLDANALASKLNALARDDSSVADLHKVGLSLAALGKPVDGNKFSKLLLAAIKRDENLLNTGLALQLASKFNSQSDKLSSALEVVAQADEVGDKYLQFEGGLSVTSAIVSGVYEYAQATNKPAPFGTSQAMKFVNYFLSRKHVLSPKGASDLVSTLKLLTNNKYHIPYSVSVYATNTLSKGNTVLTVKVCNVLGQNVGPVSVTGVSLTQKGGNPFAQNIAFKQVTGDSTLYAYDFAAKESEIPAGEYTLFVNAVPATADPRVFGNVGAELDVIVLTEVDLVEAEVSIVDSDVGSNSIKLTYPKSLGETLEAEMNQRFLLKFALKDRRSGKPISVHQAFLRFENEITHQEVVFVAQQEGSEYEVDLSLQSRSKDFDNLSGVYSMQLLVGDKLVNNPVNWKLGKIHLKLAGSPADPETNKSNDYQTKPEIRHLFREQDKRPHEVISNFFTLLCMSPLVLLIVLWLFVGVKLNGFELSLSGLVFHASLGAIFLLYGCFFLKLNMFQTIKWLAGLGAVVFLSGHSLLSRLIKKHK